jgi:hypothetical protein
LLYTIFAIVILGKQQWQIGTTVYYYSCLCL